MKTRGSSDSKPRLLLPSSQFITNSDGESGIMMKTMPHSHSWMSRKVKLLLL